MISAGVRAAEAVLQGHQRAGGTGRRPGRTWGSTCPSAPPPPPQARPESQEPLEQPCEWEAGNVRGPEAVSVACVPPTARQGPGPGSEGPLVACCPGARAPMVECEENAPSLGKADLFWALVYDLILFIVVAGRGAGGERR